MKLTEWHPKKKNLDITPLYFIDSFDAPGDYSSLVDRPRTDAKAKAKPKAGPAGLMQSKSLKRPS